MTLLLKPLFPNNNIFLPLLQNLKYCWVISVMKYDEDFQIVLLKIKERTHRV